MRIWLVLPALIILLAPLATSAVNLTAHGSRMSAECIDFDGDLYDTCDPDDPGDTDGLPADCDDNDPDVNPGVIEGASEGNCGDGKDNDCDCVADCSDTECIADASCAGCSDSDGDGATDCGVTPDCDEGNPDVYPCAAELCDDSVDNDCDFTTDCDDQDCEDDPLCGSRTWYVATTGSDSTGDGTSGNPFATIQNGIDHANAGDTVEVACGTYTEYDITMKSEVCLRSATGEADCVVIDANSVGRGFICVGVDSIASIQGFTILEGRASSGGGMRCESSSLQVMNCAFVSNTAYSTGGGGVYCTSSSTPTFTNCVFMQNTSDSDGGGMLVSNSAPTITGCVFNGNTLSFGMSEGAGIDFKGTAGGQVTSSTFVGNSGVGGCALGVEDAGTAVTVEHSILAFGLQGSAVACVGGTISLSCCDVYGNEGGDWVDCIADQADSNGNFSADPIFCEPDSGDFTLHLTSPCADAPGCGLVGALDVACGFPRTWYVSTTGSDSTGDGSSGNPFATVQNGIDHASAGDTVEVACGTYNEHDLTIKSGILLTSETGEANCAVIDAQSLGRVMSCVDIDSSTTLKGLTFTNGEGSYFHPQVGGGLYLERSSPSITDCSFVNNRITVETMDELAFGAGLYCEDSSAPVLVDCLFEANEIFGPAYLPMRVVFLGAGMYSIESSPELQNCTFLDNTIATGGLEGDAAGAGLHCQAGTITITNSVFEHNVAFAAGAVVYPTAKGGGLSASSTDLEITGTVFSRNAAADTYTESISMGGALSCHGDTPVRIAECTFWRNEVLGVGSGIFSETSLMMVENTIIVEGIGASGVGCDDPGDAPTLTCTCLWGNEGGDWVGCIEDQQGINGNISEDPLFCSPDEGDLSLHSDSPCAAENNPECGQIGAFGIGCGPSTDVSIGSVRLEAPLLHAAWPNPFTESTRIGYSIPGQDGGARVSLSVYDPAGRLVRALVDTEQSAGPHAVIWDGKNDAGEAAVGGMYFYRLSVGGQEQTQRGILIR